MKQPLNHGLVLTKFQPLRLIKNWVKNGFEKCFFKLMNNSLFEKNYGKYSET